VRLIGRAQLQTKADRRENAPVAVSSGASRVGNGDGQVLVAATTA